MISYYYSKNRLPDNIHDFKPLLILLTVDEQLSILNQLEKSILTRLNCFTEYYSISHYDNTLDTSTTTTATTSTSFNCMNNRFSELLSELFGRDYYEIHKDRTFELVIYRLDRDYFNSIKERWEYIIHDSNMKSDFIQDDQVLFVHYKII